MISITFNTLKSVMETIKASYIAAKEYIYNILGKYSMKHRDIHWSHTDEKLKYLSDIKLGKSNGKFKYTITSPEGYVFETDNMRAFCRKLKLHQPSMVTVGNGFKDDYKGFKVTKERI